MILSLALALLATAGGALATYAYDEGASLAARLCTGACTGLAAFGLIGFVLASFLGLTPLAIILAAMAAASPSALLLDLKRRQQVRADLARTEKAIRQAMLYPSSSSIAYFLYYAIASILLWQIFSRAMLELPDGISTGALNNFGDLPFHLSVITGFAFGNNFPPNDPTFAGVRFTYPFLTDFVSAVFVRSGASLRDAMFIENFIVAVSFVGVLHRWALVMLRDRLAALLTPLLVLLNGGFGFVLLFTEAGRNNEGLIGVLKHLPASFTIIPETSWRWGNAISALLLPQRGMLLGLPLAVIVFTQWWIATGDPDTEGEQGASGSGTKGAEPARRGDAENADRKRKKKKQKIARSGPEASYLRVTPTTRMIAVGFIAGLLPLVHAHSFVAVMLVASCLALGINWRAWVPVFGSLLVSWSLILGIQAGVLWASGAKVLFAGVAAGCVVGVWFLLPRRQRNLWVVFAVAASAVALPQMLWSASGSAVQATSFFAWHVGWDSDKEIFFKSILTSSQLFITSPYLRSWVVSGLNLLDVARFWLENTGVFIPLLIVAILCRRQRPLVPRRLLLFYLPFTLCFIIPNIMTLAPWPWDNIKVLFYWWLASAPLVALLLARLWQRGSARRALSVALFVCATLAGALDVAGIVLRTGEYQIFDRQGVHFAEVVKQQTQPQALIIHAPVHNTPIFLTGRRSLLGYPGHIWTHGLKYADREAEVRRIYSGAADAESLLRKYHVEYAVVGPLERHAMPVNEQFFSRFQKVGEAGEYRLYKITQ
jgi:hypothetical protein